ncbi:MAG: hypothetical protein MN733_18650 [Nitrososphaera sp.]|nr:hypothetical protein [Nitrososphaera sp.]
MDEKTAFRTITRYEHLEDQLIEFFRHVPPQDANLKAWSPTLASLIKDACGLFESLLKRISHPTVQVEGRRRRRSELEIQDLGLLYTKMLGLTRRKVILLFFPPEYRDPFKTWRNKVRRKFYKPPKWWTTHNHLKHNELTSMDEATATTAIDALAGLLLTIGSAPEMTRALLHQDLLHWRTVQPDIIVQWALAGFPEGNSPVVLKTKLFAILLGGPPLPKDINDFRPLAHTHIHVLDPYFRRLL